MIKIFLFLLILTQIISENSKKILVIGSIGYDLTTFLEKMPKAGETIVGRKFAQNPGGKGNNQAIASTRTGGETTFLGAVGDDLYGQIIKENLDVNNVKNILKIVPNVPSQIATILVEKNGQNRIVIIQGANNYVDKKQIDENINLIEESDIIILQLEIPMKTVEYVIEIAHKKNKIIILNPAPGAKLSEEIIKKVDFLTPNENELSIISEMPTDNIEQIEKASIKMINLGVKNLIVTLGDKGCLLINKERKRLYPSYPTKPVDTAGAGDCFNGVFATYLSKGYPLDEAIKYANLASSISVSRVGTVPSFPYKDEIEEARDNIKEW